MKLLKMLVLAGALSALVLSGGCRKKTDSGMELATLPRHCYNEELDADELVVDYGGSCGTSSGAVSMSSDCGQANNTAKLTVSGLSSPTNYTVTSCVRTAPSASYYLYRLNLSGGGYIEVRTLQSCQLNQDLSFTTGVPSDDDECTVYFSAGSITGSCSGTGSSQVRIKYNGASYAVNLCNASWYIGFNTGQLSAYATVN